MTQPKRTRRRTPKPELSAEEFAFCEHAINEYDKALEDRFYRGRLSEGRYAFCEMKLTEWYDTLLVRGGVTE
ncbi:hypothetical protein I532_04145 [Brevibacillus borstelensis AK1]|uniref:Uncharacterized protein n=1 Tax=Brevibacillus borstelensis AK1 TaxID=1300222 RepID=M8DMQ7_9BACL|nr:hypothetical protein [Brevibacillus borstelensis]EMT54767.1 hypothetical protein I532_04145 [Brevibacillus borstelensis AK1]